MEQPREIPTYTERMTALCRSIPYLADKPGFGLDWQPGVAFCADQLDGDEPEGEHPFPSWAAGSSAAIEAVRFVRHVWNSHNPAPSLVYWDRAHREAFAAWAADPWWC